MAKKIYFFSVQNQVGKTTIANYLALELSKKSLTSIVELNRYCGYSPYIQDKIAETKSLTNIYNNENIEDNLVQSSFSEKLFFTSKNLIDELLDLHNINTASYNKLYRYLDEKFDFSIIDLPANYIEKMLHDALDNLQTEDLFIIVLDDNIQNYQLLKHYDNYFYENNLNIPRENIKYILNKNKFDNKNQAKKIVDSLNVFKTDNEFISIPYVEDILLYTNEGKIIKNPSSKNEKLFLAAIKNIHDFIYKIPKKENKGLFKFSFKGKRTSRDKNVNEDIEVKKGVKDELYKKSDTINFK